MSSYELIVFNLVNTLRVHEVHQRHSISEMRQSFLFFLLHAILLKIDQDKHEFLFSIVLQTIFSSTIDDDRKRCLVNYT